MDDIFNNAKSFNQNISGWSTMKLTTYENIFKDCKIKEDYKPKFKEFEW
jgi:hypothetical protein